MEKQIIKFTNGKLSAYLDTKLPKPFSNFMRNFNEILGELLEAF